MCARPPAAVRRQCALTLLSCWRPCADTARMPVQPTSTAPPANKGINTKRYAIDVFVTVIASTINGSLGAKFKPGLRATWLAYI